MIRHLSTKVFNLLIKRQGLEIRTVFEFNLIIY